ncbi:MAG: RNA polymerase subunit sigma-70 [Phycisphaerae bacterium]|nr:RNA polymerase subunit sigma-70 [Phycisphaerae bacterium]
MPTSEPSQPDLAFTSPSERARIIDGLLQRRQRGDLSALRELWDQIYAEVHRMARSRLRSEGPRRPIDTTVLVHELYLKAGDVAFENRAHLFGSLVRMMGQVIIDSGRRAQLERRTGTTASGGAIQLDLVQLGFDPVVTPELSGAIVQALDRLDASTPRAASVAWLRFVGGLELEETATCLDISRRTVVSDWKFARAWLRRELSTRYPELSPDGSSGNL